MNKLLLFVAPALLLAFTSCDIPGVSSDPTVKVSATDEAMNAAMETARKTFGKFQDNWKKMPSSRPSVKFGVPTSDDSIEFIWFQPIQITETEFIGICSNDPAKVPGLKLGDTRTFKLSEVADWMIIKDLKCYGGYTVRVLCDREPENAPPFIFVDF